MTDSLPFFLSVIAARTVIVLLVLLVGVRIFGKRQVGGMNIYDLVLVLLLANAVQNAMTQGSGLLGVGIVSAGVLLLVDRFLGTLFVKRPTLEARLVGTPTIIIKDGQLEPAHMRREGVTEEEVLAALRGYGLNEPADVKLAVLEADGSLSVVPVRHSAPDQAKEPT
ncbi:MAG: DUF421 domain-containing protein [Chloroflexota bacterium]